MDQDPEQTMKDIELDLNEIKNGLNSIRSDEDCFKLGSLLNDFNNQIKGIENKLSDLDNEIQDYSSNKNPLITKSDSLRTELEIIKTLYRKRYSDWETKDNQRKFREGQLSGIEYKKASKNAMLNANKEMDMQGDMIDQIGKNVSAVHNNQVNIMKELDRQGKVISATDDRALEGIQKVKQTDTVITQMACRQRAMKVLLFICIILFGIFDAVWIIYWLVKKYGNKQQSK